MEYKIKNLMNKNDIVPNIMGSYPNEALLVQTENDFYDSLCSKKCSILCYHITRLTLQEIANIKKFGLAFGSKKLLYDKVANLPSCCDWFKDELNLYIKNLYDTQADDCICASYGNLDLVNDTACDNIFHTNWGGETIYRYYDDGKIELEEHFKKIRETLQKISIPCIIILRVSSNTFREADYYSLFEQIKKNNLEKIEGALYITETLPEVVHIIDLNKYNGIDFT